MFFVFRFRPLACAARRAAATRAAPLAPAPRLRGAFPKSARTWHRCVAYYNASEISENSRFKNLLNFIFMFFQSFSRHRCFRRFFLVRLAWRFDNFDGSCHFSFTFRFGCRCSGLFCRRGAAQTLARYRAKRGPKQTRSRPHPPAWWSSLR